MEAIQEKVKKAYDALTKSEVNPRDSWGYIMSKMQVDYRLLSEVSIKGKTILNVGCGYPLDEIYFASRIGTWVSVDISPESIKKARTVCEYELPSHFSEKISFQEADATDLPFKNESFDIVVSFSAIDHVPGKDRRKRVLHEIARVAKKGGYVVITVPNLLNVRFYIYNKRFGQKVYGFAHCFTPWELRKMLTESGLSPLRFASTFWIIGRRMGYLARKGRG